MASPLSIKNKTKLDLYLPKKIDLAINLIQAFIKNNNTLGLKIAILLSGAKDKIEYDEHDSVLFNIDELCSLCRVDRRYLSSNKKKMTETYYEYVDENNNLNGTRPIHSFTYENKNDNIRISISRQAKSLFNNLKSKDNIDGFRFTQAISRNLMIYDLKDVHKHTLKMQMLLEMINSFSHAKRKYFSIEELNGYFGTNYIRFGDFNRYILKRVQEDTMKYSTISFLFEEKTQINKIVGITIDVIDNQNLFTS